MHNDMETLHPGLPYMLLYGWVPKPEWRLTVNLVYQARIASSCHPWEQIIIFKH